MDSGLLIETCRAVAAGIPGASALPLGGIEFARRSFPARVEFGPYGYARGWTDILFATGALAPESLLVRTAGLWHDVKNLFGVRDHQTGDAAFDARFEVTTSDPGFAGRMLTPDMRNVLASVSIHGPFLWRVSRAGFLLRLEARPRTARELDGWLVAAFQLLDELPGVEGAERVQVGETREAIGEESECQVCGTTLRSGQVVRCARCRTPHHRDCWEFNGRCSTFACGETRSR